VPDCVLIHVGTGQVYGSSPAGQPLREDSLLIPTNAYTASKAAADLALGAFRDNGLRCIRFRPFNHTGPGQSSDYVVPGFAWQVARIEAGLQPPVIQVGNLDVERDFLDVRDVVSAYARAVRRSSTIPPGTIFNLASGVPRRIQSILDTLIGFARQPITVSQDRARMRPHDVPTFVGDATHARQALDWNPTFALEQTLRDVFDDACEQIRRDQSPGPRAHGYPRIRP